MSYIPRSSAVPPGSSAAIPRLVRKRHTFRLFGFVAVVLLVASILGSVGTYVYGNILEEQLADTQVELAQTAAGADLTTEIRDLESFEKKMETAQLLLDTHQAPSLLFKNLELTTKNSIQFTGFTYSYDPGFEALLELRGVTSDLPSVALQNGTFLEDAIFEGFDIKEISLGSDAEEPEKTVVNFTVTGVIERDDFAYNGTPAPQATQVLDVPAALTATGTLPAMEEGTSTESAIIE